MKQIMVAWKLKEIAELLELLGENAFKVKAYRQAATNLEKLTEDLETVWREGRLEKIEGIGSSIAGRIEEILSQGDTPYLAELRSRMPEGLTELLTIPGVGPRVARKLRDNLGVTTISELEAALKAGKVRTVPGLDGRIEGIIQRGLKQIRTDQGRILLGLALPYGREMLLRLQRVPGVKVIQIVGSARRYQESIATLELLAVTTDGEKLLQVFTTMADCENVIEKSGERAVIRTRYGITVELVLVSSEDFPLAQILTTGPQTHLEQLKALGSEMGWQWADGQWRNQQGEKLSFDAENTVYERLGLGYIIPELREDAGAIRAAREGWLPISVCREEILGDLHMHTRWSDGVDSIEEMAETCQGLGYKYMAICDHSRSLRIAKGMSIEVLKEQIKAIDELNAGFKDFRILKGVEVDILKNGELDYPDELLARLDIVVASIHSGFAGSEEELTNRIVAAMRNPYVHIIAHPTGRLIQQREPYQVNIERLVQVAKETGTVLEVNATPDRLDLRDEHLKLCKAMGVRVAINTDAHSVEQLKNMEYGVGMARRGWLEQADVLNTYSLTELLVFLARKRRDCK